MLLDSFTYFSLSGPWVGIEGVALPGIVCILQANALNCFLASGRQNTTQPSEKMAMSSKLHLEG